MKSLIFVFFVVETALILSFGLLLYITDGVDPGTFEACCIASARAITDLGNWSDSQFSWLYGDSVMSMDIAVQGVIIIILEGWVHFLWVCVASSLIIVKALVPMQQVAFSHHAVLTENELVIRIRVLRPLTTVLVCPEVRVDVCTNSGTFIKLPLNGGGCYAKWSGSPTLTIRHKVTEDSPFYDEKKENGPNVITTPNNCSHVSCSFPSSLPGLI